MSKSRKMLAQTRKAHVVRMKAGIILAIAVLLVGCVTTKKVFAENTKGSNVQKQYKSIEIKSGDSLWSIAKEHRNANQSVQDYIKELKSINSLVSDDIKESDYLVVAYYEESIL